LDNGVSFFDGEGSSSLGGDQISLQSSDTFVGSGELSTESEQLGHQGLVFASCSGDLVLGGSQVSGGSLGGGHDLVELGLVPRIGVLSSGGLHDGLVLAADVAEGKGQLVGESGSEGIGAQVDGHQSLHLFFVEIGQESDLILLGRKKRFELNASDDFGIACLLGSGKLLLEGGDGSLESTEFDFHGRAVLSEEVDLRISFRDHLLELGDGFLRDQVSLIFGGVESGQFGDLGL